MAIEGELSLQIGKFNSNLKTAESNSKSSTQRMSKDARNAQDSFAGGLSGGISKGLGVKGLAAPLLLAAAGYKAARFAADAFNAAREREALTAGLASISSENAADQLERLKALAKEPGLGMNQVINASTNLQAVGLSAAKAEALIREMGNALALVGKGKADMDGITLALTQIAAKGKVTAQEINQMAERLPQIRTLMKAAFGTANTEIIQKMGITVDEFFTKITAAAADLPRAMRTMNEQLGNLDDDFLELKVKAGELFTPLIAELIPLASSLFQTLSGAVDGYRTSLEELGAWMNNGDIKQVNKDLDEQLEILRKRQNIKAEKEISEGDKQEFLEGGLSASAFLKAKNEERARGKIRPPQGPIRPKPKELTEKEQKIKDKKDAAAKIAAEKEEAAVTRRFSDKAIADAVKAGDVDALTNSLDSLLSKSVGTFPFYEKSIAGLEKLANARLKAGQIGAADEALKWLKDAEKLQNGIDTATEDTAKSLASLREQADTGAFELLDPKQQAAQLRKELGTSLGIDVTGASDVEAGLKGLRAEVAEARAAGDTEAEKEALKKLQAAQTTAGKLAGLAETDDEGKGRTRAASGGVANALAQIAGRASQDDVLLDATRSQVTVMKQLNSVLKKIKDDGLKIDTDTFTF